MKRKNEAKVQFNTRIRPQYRDAAGLCAAVTKMSMEELVETMIRATVGIDDAETRQLKDKAVKAYKAVGEPLPFNIAFGQPRELQLATA